MSEKAITLENDPGLKRRLGVPAIVFSVVAWAAPLLVVQGLMPSMVVYSRNSLVLAFFLLTIILLFFGTGYANITKHVENPGAYYAYITAGLGRSAGLGGAFVAILAYALLMLSTWVAFGTFFRTLVMMFGGPDIPWYVYALLGAVVSGIVAYVRVDFSTSVMMVLLACESILVAMFIIAVLVKGGPLGGMSITPLTPEGWGDGSLALGMLYAMLGFIGFESATIYREEAKDPVKTITISIYTAIIAIGIFYLFAAWCMLTAMGPDWVASLDFDEATTLFNDLCTTYLGPWVPVLTNIFICTSTFACLLAQHNSLSRYLYSLGKDGIIPKRFGMAHPKTGSPAFAVIVVTIASFVFIFISMIASGFTRAGEVAYTIYIKVNGMGTLTVITLMVLVSIAILAFFMKRRSEGNELTGGIFKSIIAPLIGLIGLVIMFILVIINVDAIVGFSKAVSIIIAIIVLPAVFFWGYGIANRLKKISPERYQKIGRN